MSDVTVGIDVGGTKMAVAIGSPDGEIFNRTEFPTLSPAEAMPRWMKEIGALVGSDTIKAIGLSVPGPMSSAQGMILNPPNLLDWHNVPIKKLFEDVFNVPVGIENDANAAALAEWRWGGKKAIHNLIYLTCGTGLGAGLILDGRLYRGRHDLAGEVGHVRLRNLGPVGFYKSGSVEGLTSGTGIGKLAQLRLEETHPPSSLDRYPLNLISGKIVGDAALEGDVFAQEIIKESASYLGEFCAILIDTLNPERISLGSHARRLGAMYVDAVRAAAKKESLPAAFEGCIIDGALLGERVQDLGALAVAAEVIGK